MSRSALQNPSPVRLRKVMICDRRDMSKLAFGQGRGADVGRRGGGRSLRHLPGRGISPESLVRYGGLRMRIVQVDRLGTGRRTSYVPDLEPEERSEGIRAVAF